jgi:hypothetical protein
MFRLLTLAFAAAFLLVLQSCGAPSPHVSGVEWKGEPLRVIARSDKPGIDALRAAGFDALHRHPPQRILAIAPGEWGDSLRLLEFHGELQAYAAFQELASNPEDIPTGISPCGERVCFRRGRWIGVVDAWSWKGGGWMEDALALPEGSLPGELPAAFGSMPHRGRIPGTERILTDVFMGQASTVMVFAVRADCRGDTAWLYAAPDLQPSFGDSLVRLQRWRADSLKTGLQTSAEFLELSPATLRFSGNGMAGVEGCFDKDLTSDWLKNQSAALKSLK